MWVQLLEVTLIHPLVACVLARALVDELVREDLELLPLDMRREGEQAGDGRAAHWRDDEQLRF